MTYNYFAYASNLSTGRMQICCPGALVKKIGILKDFKLVFSGYAEPWNGSKASIISSPGDHVWGVIWEIRKEYEKLLDKQEPGYDSVEMIVSTPEGDKVPCKLYQKDISGNEIGLPSAIYKSVIIKGAIEHGLPDDYINYLRNIKDNDYTGDTQIPVTVSS